MKKELTIENHFLFEQPIKVVWSDYHNQMIVLGLNSVCLFNPDTFEVKPFQSTENNFFKDIAISNDGNLALLLQSNVFSSGEIKVLSSNLFSIKKTIRVSEYILKFSKFTKDGNLIIIAESTVQSAEPGDISSKVIFIEFKSGKIGEGNIITKGCILGVEINSDNKAFAISSGGDVLSIPTKILDFDTQNSSESSIDSSVDTVTSESSLNIIRFKPQIIGSVGPGVSSFSIGLKTISVSDETQKKVRIFVGSRPWQNDRWDSQEIESQNTNILYGGGDNLIPGRSYWVHVSVWHNGSGWARPQIRKFTMPICYYEDYSSSSSSYSSLSTEILTTSSSYSSKSSSSMSSTSSSSISSSSQSSISSSSQSSISSSSQSSISSSSQSSSSSSSQSSKSSSSSSSSLSSLSSRSSSSSPSSFSSSSSQSYEAYEGLKIATSGSYAYSSGNPGVWISLNGGVSWSQRIVSKITHCIFMSANGDIITAVMENGDIYNSQNAGTTFALVSHLGGVPNTLDGGACSASGQYQTVCINYPSPNILYSSDFGSTWTPVISVPNELYYGNVKMSKDGQNQIIIGNAIIKSSDYGQTWTYLSEPFLASCFCSWNDTQSLLSIRDDGWGYDKDRFFIMKSIDGGINWETIKVFKDDRSSEGGGIVWDPTECISCSMDGQYISVLLTSLRISRDYGQTWTEYPTITGRSLSASGSGKFITIGDIGSVHYSSDYGVNWSTKRVSPIGTQYDYDFWNIANSSGLPF